MKKIIIYLLVSMFLSANTNFINTDCLNTYIKYAKKRNKMADKKANKKLYVIRNIIFSSILLSVPTSGYIYYCNNFRR